MAYNTDATCARINTHSEHITKWIHSMHDVRSRGGEIGGAGGASAPPLWKQGGLSPPILSHAILQNYSNIVLS